MNGLEFLALAHEKSPDTVQIILTSNADVQSAIEAMNSGRIFRFLQKPCPQELLEATLLAAIDHYTLKRRQTSALTEAVPEEVRSELENLNEQLLSSEKKWESLRSQVNPAEDRQAMPALDPVTGLPGESEARRNIAACALQDTVHVVVFALRQIQQARARFGNGIGDQLIHFASQSLANRLSAPWAADGLYRWRGAAVVMLVQNPCDIAEVATEVRNVGAIPMNFHFETRSRNAYIPLRIAATVVSGANAEQVMKQIDEFITTSANSAVAHG